MKEIKTYINEAEIFLVTVNSNIKTYEQLEILVSISQLADSDVYMIMMFLSHITELFLAGENDLTCT